LLVAEYWWLTLFLLIFFRNSSKTSLTSSRIHLFRKSVYIGLGQLPPFVGILQNLLLVGFNFHRLEFSCDALRAHGLLERFLVRFLLESDPQYLLRWLRGVFERPKITAQFLYNFRGPTISLGTRHTACSHLCTDRSFASACRTGYQ